MMVTPELDSNGDGRLGVHLGSNVKYRHTKADSLPMAAGAASKALGRCFSQVVGGKAHRLNLLSEDHSDPNDPRNVGMESQITWRFTGAADLAALWWGVHPRLTVCLWLLGQLPKALWCCFS